jgi:hypothetical protein
MVRIAFLPITGSDARLSASASHDDGDAFADVKWPPKPHVFDMREFDSMMKRHRKEGVMTGSIVDQEQFVVDAWG